MKNIKHILPVAAMLLTFLTLSISASDLMAQRRGNTGATCPPAGQGYGYQNQGPRGSSQYQNNRGRDGFVRNIPSSAQRHKMGRDVYFSHRGTYYQQVRRGYQIVPAPVGLRVRVLPRGARMIDNGRKPVFASRGSFFQYVPRYDVYEVIREPRGVDDRQYDRNEDRGRDRGRSDDYSYDNNRGPSRNR